MNTRKVDVPEERTGQERMGEEEHVRTKYREGGKKRGEKWTCGTEKEVKWMGWERGKEMLQLMQIGLIQ